MSPAVIMSIFFAVAVCSGFMLHSEKLTPAQGLLLAVHKLGAVASLVYFILDQYGLWTLFPEQFNAGFAGAVGVLFLALFVTGALKTMARTAPLHVPAARIHKMAAALAAFSILFIFV